MRDLSRDLDRAFVNPFGGNFLGERGRPSIGDGYDFSPAVNTYETDKEYVVEAQVPGFTAETLQILHNDHGLTLKGERKQEHEDKKAKLPPAQSQLFFLRAYAGASRVAESGEE